MGDEIMAVAECLSQHQQGPCASFEALRKFLLDDCLQRNWPDLVFETNVVRIGMLS